MWGRLDSWGQFFCQLSETEREDEEEGRASGRGEQLRYERGSCASRVCARTSTHPNHSTSPPLEDKGAEDEDEEENGDEDADADEDEDSDEEVHGGAAGEQGAGDGKIDYLVAFYSKYTGTGKSTWTF